VRPASAPTSRLLAATLPAPSSSTAGTLASLRPDAPRHFAEITTRNAVVEALTAVYGARWPWNPTFVRSLPNPKGKVFNLRRNLQVVASHELTTGKVIAELKFVFWQTMFTACHDGRARQFSATSGGRRGLLT
jgi:hypothetical protein